MSSFLTRLLIQTLALLVLGYTLPGIQVDGLAPAVVAALILSLINAILRPLLILLTFPITLVTLGLFVVVINGVCLALTAYLVQGFAISSFAWAMLGALLMSLVSWLLNISVYDKTREDPQGRRTIHVESRVIR